MSYGIKIPNAIFSSRLLNYLQVSNPFRLTPILAQFESLDYSESFPLAHTHFSSAPVYVTRPEGT